MDDNTKYICFDVETTGLDTEKDEILQLSIIDGKNNVLLNKYFKPKKHKSWKQAEYINGITPEMVANEKTIKSYLKEIQKIFDEAEVLVGYNIYFDIAFLSNSGIKFKKEYKIYDVMLDFAEIYGDWSEYHQDYVWKKLSTCAKFYNYEFKAHDSLEDVKATLYCFYKMRENDQRKQND